MTSFAVDIAQVQAANAAIVTRSQNISAEVRAMMSQLTALASTWQGAASLQFQEVCAQWQGTQAQVETSLMAINGALTRTASTYQEAESLVRANFTM